MPAPQSTNLDKLQKEAAPLGISLDRDDDGTFWGKVQASGMELGGYDTATAALEDLKAVVTLDGATDLFEYDNDPDDETLYRVTYKKDDMVFTDPALAVALSDALAHHTEQSRPAQPQPAKRRGMRKASNGPQTIEHEPTVEETLPEPPKEPPPPAKFAAPKPDKKEIEKNLIRSEDPGPTRAIDTISPQQQISVALMQLSKAIEEIARNLGNEAMLPYGSAFEEPEAPKPARNRRSSN
jgi:hypothetical protein